MKRNFKYLLVAVLCIVMTACGGNKKPGSINVPPDEISRVLDTMTRIMIHDVTNPPLASRFFSYACLAGYEVVAQNNTRFKGMQGVLNAYPIVKKPNATNYSYQLASVFAMLEVASKMQPSGRYLEGYKDDLYKRYLEKGMREEDIKSSQAFGNAIATEILKYAKEDGYRKISDFQRYTPLQGAAYWYPTPPAFMSAVEPRFNTVRPFYLDSLFQFKPISPTAFDSTKGSSFYKLMEEVYNEGISINEEHRAIASFWDCNPFAVQNEGHLQVGIKKISPGAHWLGIAAIASRKAQLSFDKTMLVMTSLSTTLMDAFICCWDEKYRSNRIRPESAIRRYIDPNWQPLLQTPPFPEYLSGHSVISAASAEILSHFFGDTFTYTDSTEIPYGLPPRHFTSFRNASNEAGVSRFYGGIHFIDAIVIGQSVGEKIGKFTLKKSDEIIKDQRSVNLK